MRNSIILLLFFILPAAAQSQTLINTKAPEFSLKDQFDKPVSIRELEGRVVVLIACDKEGSAQNAEWKNALIKKYGHSIVLMGVADLRGTPFFMKGIVKGNFKEERGSVLLDWGGSVFTRYGLKQKVTNVIVIDKKGYLRYLHSGPAGPGVIDRVFNEIDAVK